MHVSAFDTRRKKKKREPHKGESQNGGSTARRLGANGKKERREITGNVQKESARDHLTPGFAGRWRNRGEGKNNPRKNKGSWCIQGDKGPSKLRFEEGLTVLLKPPPEPGEILLLKSGGKEYNRGQKGSKEDYRETLLGGGKSRARPCKLNEVKYPTGVQWTSPKE